MPSHAILVHADAARAMLDHANDVGIPIPDVEETVGGDRPAKRANVAREEPQQNEMVGSARDIVVREQQTFVASESSLIVAGNHLGFPAGPVP